MMGVCNRGRPSHCTTIGAGGNRQRGPGPWVRYTQRAFGRQIGAAVISFLMAFEDFSNTVLMYGRMREGASPVLNAVSLFPSALVVALMWQGPRRSRSD